MGFTAAFEVKNEEKELAFYRALYFCRRKYQRATHNVEWPLVF